MAQSSIHHNSDSIVITIETSSPAGTHHLLMKGINKAIQYYISHPDKQDDADALVELMKLQEAILPHEHRLQKAFK